MFRFYLIIYLSLFFVIFLEGNICSQTQDDIKKVEEGKQLHIAESMMKDGLYETSAEQFQKFVTDFPKSERVPEAMYKSAKCYFLAKDYYKASLKYQSFLNSYPKSEFSAVAYFELGETLFNLGRYNEALKCYVQNLTLLSEDDIISNKNEYPAQAQMRIGDCYLHLDDYTLALKSYQDAISKYPKSKYIPDIYSQMGITYIKKGDVSLAIQSFEKVVKNYPQSELSLLSQYQIAEIYYHQEQYDSAISEYMKCVKDTVVSVKRKSNLTPAEADIEARSFFGIGESFFGKGDFKSAVIWYKILYIKYPSNSISERAIYRCALAYKENGQCSNTIKELNLLNEKYPNNSLRLLSYYTNAECLAELGEIYQAMDKFEDLSVNNPQTDVGKKSRLKIAELYYKNSNYRESANQYQKYIFTYPQDKDNEDILLKLGEIYQSKLNRIDLAIRAYQDVILNYPKSKKIDKAQLKLAECYYDIQNYSQSIKEYRRLLENYPGSSLKNIALDRIAYIEEYHLKDYDKSVIDLFNQLQNGELDAYSLFNIAEIYRVQLRKYDEAIKLYQLILKKYPESEVNASCQYGLGEAYYGLANKCKLEGNLELYSNYLAKSYDAHQFAKANYPNSQWTTHSYLRMIEIELINFKGTKEEYYRMMLSKYLSFVKQYPESPQLDYVYTLIGDAQQGTADLGDKTFYKYAIENYSNVLNRYEKSKWSEKAKMGIADCYFKLGDYNSSLEWYLKVVQEYPNGEYAVSALFNIAKSEMELKHYISAIGYYERIIKNYPYSQQSEYSIICIGDAYSLLGEYNKAIESYKLLPRDYPNSDLLPIYYSHLAKAYWNSGTPSDKDKAVEIWEMIVDKYSNDAIAEESLFKIAESIPEDSTKSILAYSRFLDKYPQSELAPRALRKLSDLQFAHKRYNDASHSYQKLLSDAKSRKTVVIDSAEIEFRIVICLYRQGLSNEISVKDRELLKKSAEESADRFKKKYPDDVNRIAGLLFERAEYYRKLNKFDIARENYERLIKEYPTSLYVDDSAYNIGVLYLNKGESEKATEIFRNFVNKYPESEFVPNAYFSLGTSYFISRKYRDAVSSYKQVINSKSSDVKLKENATYNLALCYENLEDWKSALETHREFIDSFSSSADFKTLSRARFKLGYAYFELNSYNDAISNFLKAKGNVDEETGAEIQFWLGECYFNLGNFEQAVVEYLSLSYLYPKQDLWVVTAEYKAGIAYERLNKLEEAKKIYRKIIEKKGLQNEWGMGANERLKAIEGKK